MFTRVQYPITTQLTNAVLWDRESLYRGHEIDSTLRLLNQDTGKFHLVLDKVSKGPPVAQKMYWFVEDEPQGISTRVNYTSGYSATATSVVVDDAKAFGDNSLAVIPRTMELVKITDVNYTTNTLTVTRAVGQGGVGFAIVDNDAIVALPQEVAELQDPNLGTGVVPGTPDYNFVSELSTSFQVSNVQAASRMIDTGIGEIGKVPFHMANTELTVRRQVNMALIFGRRGSESTVDGYIYRSGGFLQYAGANVFNIGGNIGNLAWPNISDWLDLLCDPTASSPGKVIFAGERLFGAFNRMRRDMSTPSEQYLNPSIGVGVGEGISVTTENGHSCTIIRDKFGFPADHDLAGCGIVVDMAHCRLREFNGMPLRWRMDIQPNNARYVQHEFTGTYSLEVTHPSVHGYINGAPKDINE